MPETDELSAGLYETLVTATIEKIVARLGDRATVGDVIEPESPIRLADHIRLVAERMLAEYTPEEQVALVNLILTVLTGEADQEGDSIVPPPRLLEAVLDSGSAGLGTRPAPPRPSIPLSQDSLLVNAPGDPSLAAALRREIGSADTIDLLSAFVVWTGLRVVVDELRDARARGARIRVITSTYTATTDVKALDELAAMGADVKVSYEVGATRLHAKAWLFERNSGFSTAYVGSSNLSHTALHEGIEWNVRLTQHSSPRLLDRFRATFETYWADERFDAYEREKFIQAIGAIRRDNVLPMAMLEVRPLDFQARMLERLEVERERFDRHRNLIVAATGTGKTVLAALDYDRLAREWNGARLLFVAHRQEILTQSLATFRAVVRDGNFGELMVGGNRPVIGDHVFASIQSLAQVDLDQLPADHYDVVIIDEFHHAAAPTYRRLLDHVRPRELVGLTATPERTDLQDITDWFDHHISAELRLWEAIDYGYLSPFQYFGISDGSNLETVAFKRGRYDLDELDRVYTGNDARVRIIVDAIGRLIEDPPSMRAFGYCVSVDHARFMARRFTELGIPSVAVTGSTPDHERHQALEDLRWRRVNCVFSVEVFNEGVDVPTIDTVLFLRPTESATIFLQQLGRGLRRAPDKPGLTVLDFIGQQNRAFRFAPRFQALTGRPVRRLQRDVEADFPFLPAGCYIKLDRVSREIVLNNVRRAIRSRRLELAAELRELGDVSLSDYLDQAGRSLDDLYPSSPLGWMALRRLAGLPAPPQGPDELALVRGVGRLRHIDDPERVALYTSWLRSPSPVDGGLLNVRQRRLLDMLMVGLGGGKDSSVGEAVQRLWRHPAVCQELAEMLDYVGAEAEVMPADAGLGPEIPLALHERYTRT
ncbi:MAG: DEAD/DEAH box helicase family protein, partial [Acidimicrobiaceae bacterium]|nr:DEAD/DEAH box helicase family protein [Acidimicrobiaceae bacterium]